MRDDRTGLSMEESKEGGPYQRHQGEGDLMGSRRFRGGRVIKPKHTQSLCWERVGTESISKRGAS